MYRTYIVSSSKGSFCALLVINQTYFITLFDPQFASRVHIHVKNKMVLYRIWRMRYDIVVEETCW